MTGSPSPYDPTRHGRTSTYPAWKAAEAATAREKREGVSWVPLTAIYRSLSLQPRSKLDLERVRQYAEVIEELPPVRVQRDTLTLIDGWHRTAAGYEVAAEIVPVVEIDIEDDDLLEAAFRTNAHHGLPLVLADRLAYAKLLLARHPDWHAARVAAESGLHRQTIANVKTQLGAVEPAGAAPNLPGENGAGDDVENRHHGKHKDSRETDARPREKTRVAEPEAADEHPVVRHLQGVFATNIASLTVAEVAGMRRLVRDVADWCASVLELAGEADDE